MPATQGNGRSSCPQRRHYNGFESGKCPLLAESRRRLESHALIEEGTLVFLKAENKMVLRTSEGWVELQVSFFSQPLTCGNYPRETFITLTCSFFCYPGSSNEVRPKDRGDDDHTVSNQRRGRENWTPWHDDYHHAAAAATMATSA